MGYGKIPRGNERTGFTLNLITKNMIGIVTNSRYNFERYLVKHGLSKETAVHIYLLKHVIGTIYSDVVFIEGSTNVPDAVTNKIKVKQLS